MPWYGFRLHSAGGKAWCAGSAQKSEWLLVDLGVASTISGIVTQGRGAVKEWITNFMVSYSSDAYNWDYARDIYGNKKVSAFGSSFTGYPHLCYHASCKPNSNRLFLPACILKAGTGSHL